MSKLLSEEQIEKLFQNHLKDKIGSGTRKSFYGRNKGMEASARTAFTHALTLLMPIIEKQMEALEAEWPGEYGAIIREHHDEFIQETKQMLEKLGENK